MHLAYKNAGNPLKIKVQTDKNMEEFIRSKLKDVGINEEIHEIVSVYDDVALKIERKLEIVKVLMVVGIILIIAILFITIQSIIIFYEINIQDFVTKRMLGFWMGDIYLKFYKIIIGMYALMIGGTGVAYILKIKNSIGTFIILIGILLLEIIISVIVFKVKERKSIIKVVKGGK